jgi:hypothetical protein
MSMHRVGVLIVAPVCLALAVLVGYREAFPAFDNGVVLRIVGLAAVGGWLVGRW